MSYTLTLDEIGTDRLKSEWNFRKELADKGNCTYCERPINVVPTCKMKDRHKGEDHSELTEYI